MGFRFASVGETTGGDGITGAGVVGRDGVSEVSIGTRSWASGVGVCSGRGVGTSGCGFTSDVLASDLGAGLSPDSADS